MQKECFTVTFFAVEKSSSHEESASLIKYSAVVKVVSRSFELFSVSSIKRIREDCIIYSPGSCILTCYPSAEGNQKKWKDASSFQTNEFVQMIGAAIEEAEKKAILFSVKEPS